MKKLTIQNSILLLGVIFLMASCGNQVSILKRQYGSGWYIGGGKGTKTERIASKNHRKPVTEKAAVVVADNAAVTAEVRTESTAAETPVLLQTAPQKMNFVQKQILKKTAKMISRSMADLDKIQVEKTGKTAVLKSGHKMFNSNFANAEVDKVLIIILCFFIPPLAVFLYEGQQWTNRCTLNLILTLLCGIPGVIHALIVVLGGK